MTTENLQARDELAESLNDLFTSISIMVKTDLQGTEKELEALEKMNRRVEEEYAGFGDVAAGLRVFVEQLKNKNGGFDEYVERIEGSSSSSMRGSRMFGESGGRDWRPFSVTCYVRDCEFGYCSGKWMAGCLYDGCDLEEWNKELV